MRLLVISAALPPMQSGEAGNTFFLCNHVREAGVDVTLLTSRQARPTCPEGVEVWPIMESWSWREMRRLEKAIRQARPDGILLFYQGGIYQYHPMITFAATLAKRALPEVPFVTRFEHAQSKAKPHIGGLSGRIARKVCTLWAGARGCSYGFGTLFRDSDALIALCRNHIDILRADGQEIDSKMHMIPPPPNIAIVADRGTELRDAGRELIGASEDEFVLGFFGMIYKDKGIETLLEAVAELVSRGERVRLAVVGGPSKGAGIDDDSIDYFESVQRLAVDLGVSDVVFWAGGFSAVDETIASYMHAVDAFVLPFDHGVQLNNSSFSALAGYEKIIITTRTPLTDEEFVDKTNVLFCEPRDPESIVTAAQSLIRDADLAARVRSGIRDMTRAHFSWPGAVSNTLKLFEVERS